MYYNDRNRKINFENHVGFKRSYSCSFLFLFIHVNRYSQLNIIVGCGFPSSTIYLSKVLSRGISIYLCSNYPMNVTKHMKYYTCIVCTFIQIQHRTKFILWLWYDSGKARRQCDLDVYSWSLNIYMDIYSEVV